MQGAPVSLAAVVVVHAGKLRNRAQTHSSHAYPPFFLSNTHLLFCQVMVAEAASRRRGLAREALTLLMAYAISALNITRFVAKIGEANLASVALFRGLGYVEVGRSEVFKEVTLEMDAHKQQVAQAGPGTALIEAAQRLRLGVYDEGDGDANGCLAGPGCAGGGNDVTAY